MVDAAGKFRDGQDGPVGLNLAVKPRVFQSRAQRCNTALLQERFAPRDHQVGTTVGQYRVPHVFHAQGHHLVFVAVVVPVPGVLGVTPSTRQVALGKAQEHGGRADVRAFSLERVEDLGDSPRLPADAQHVQNLPNLTRAGSGTPASAKPLARSRQLSQLPQGYSPPS